MNEVVVGLACEDNGHFTTVTTLVDAALVSAHGWLDGVVAACRSWRGVHPGEQWYKYDSDDAFDVSPIVIDGQRIAPRGYVRGERLKPEASMWRKVLLSFCHAKPRPEVVILARDLDGNSDRRAGLVQVRDGLLWPFKIVFAGPQPEVEAWLVSGFEPQNENERRRATAVRNDLSFDPTTESHRLTSHPNDARTDAKRVLELLCGGEPDRRDACLQDRSILRSRGSKNGARAFLDEVDQQIVPVFGRPQ
jgi:hypothetical protein